MLVGFQEVRLGVDYKLIRYHEVVVVPQVEMPLAEGRA